MPPEDLEKLPIVDCMCMVAMSPEDYESHYDQHGRLWRTGWRDGKHVRILVQEARP